LRYVLGTSAAAVHAAPLLLVDVESEQGVTGRSYVFCYRRSGARAVAAMLQDAAALVARETVAPVAIAARLEWRARPTPGNGSCGRPFSWRASSPRRKGRCVSGGSSLRGAPAA
jgi:hypothetical protein